MEAFNPGISPNLSEAGSEASLRKRARVNLERCLRALDQRGQQGLQEELDRIYPNPSAPLSGEGCRMLK